ncbi:proteophosphoglycan ppg4 [Rhodotorula toruloides]|uniref:Proteophosphoglycan ppg4 n=1 Tax=Rhodotorula toruloides TaxID=5286 RepID=A0A511KI10_RHOTO|nr:proteophosphoglycan ppg4 [Rhodotorula toruloides]
MPERPFLSPEYGKPTVRPGTFALDFHAVPDAGLERVRGESGSRNGRRSGTPNSLERSAGEGAALPPPVAAAGVVAPDEGHEGDAASEEEEVEDEEFSPDMQEPDWLQTSPQAEKGVSGFHLTHGEPEEEEAPAPSLDSSLNRRNTMVGLFGMVHEVPADHDADGTSTHTSEDGQLDSFDDAHSVLASSTSRQPQEAPVGAVEMVDEDEVSEILSSPEGIEVGDLPEEVILDGPGSSVGSEASSVVATPIHETAPTRDWTAPVAIAPAVPTFGHTAGFPSHEPVAATLMARAVNTNSSYDAHSDHEDCDAVEEDIRSRSGRVSPPPAHDNLARSRSPSPVPLDDRSTGHGFAAQHSPASVYDEDEDRLPNGYVDETNYAHEKAASIREAASVYPSPPSSPQPPLAQDELAAHEPPTAEPLPPVETPVAPVESPDPSASARAVTPPPPPPVISSVSTSSPPRRSSLSPPASPTTASAPAFSPGLAYQALGLRLPSSLSGNKRSSAMSPVSPPMSPEVAKASMPFVFEPLSAILTPTMEAKSSRPPAPAVVEKEREEEVQQTRDVEEPSPAVDTSPHAEPEVVPPISRDYALPANTSPASPPTDAAPANSSPAPPAEPEPAADVLEKEDHHTDTSVTDSPALSAHTAESDFESAYGDDDVPPVELPKSAESEHLEAMTATSAALESQEQGGSEGDGGVGVVDVGVAVAGALVMGGLSVGQSAWRSLSGWAWRGNAHAEQQQQQQQPEPQPQPDFERKVPQIVVVEEEMVSASPFIGSDTRSDAGTKDGSKSGERAESSVVSTEWGDAEFDMPEDFLDEFKKAMEEIGVQQVAEDDLAEQQAQQAAYLAASRQHEEAVEGEEEEVRSVLGSPTPSIRTTVFPTTGMHRSRPPSITGSVRSDRGVSGQYTRPLTPADERMEGESDEEYDELDRMMAPVWASHRRPSARQQFAGPMESTKHGYAAPPGLAGAAAGPLPASRMLSPAPSTSSTFSAAPRSVTSSTRSPQPGLPTSRSSRGLFGFGSSKSKAPKSASPQKTRPDSGSVLSGGTQPASTAKSLTSLSSVEEDVLSNSSKKQKKGRRSFLFGGPKSPTMPSIESQIADTTYVHYGTGKSKNKRRDSDMSIDASLYASRDPVLLPGQPVPVSLAGVVSSITVDSPAKSSVQSGGRRSSLRLKSRYGQADATAPVDPTEKERIYRVRFANATRGLGLRSVAEEEAVRGGDDVALKWIGVGRGRYGNLTIKEGEEMDILFDEQVKKIKGKWRAFGSERSVEWAAVRID